MEPIEIVYYLLLLMQMRNKIRAPLKYPTRYCPLERSHDQLTRRA